MSKMNTTQIPVIAIVGPTGVGKTDLSIQVAKEFAGEIINGDSMQVYRHLDIATGKILPQEMDNVPHHLFDLLEVTDEFDAASFRLQAREKIIEIYERNHLPIIVGGTGLYIEGLLFDLEFGGKQSVHPEIRQALEAELKVVGALQLWERLNKLDSQAAQKIPYQNTRRTIRALEVIETTGELFSKQASQKQQQSRFDELIIVLDRPRQKLYDRINQRVEMMVEQGSKAEALWLYQEVVGEPVQSTRGIGYKEWWPYILNQATENEVIKQIQQNSRRYAKRQLTWFRNRIKNRHWINNEDEAVAQEQVINLIQAHLNRKDIKGNASKK